jgi:hypothetical protein
VFPDITIAPKSHLVVWASGKDRVSSAAARRVNTRLAREHSQHHVVDDVNPALPGGAWEVRRARQVRVDVPVGAAGRYTLWVKARAEGIAGTLRVWPQGARSKKVTVPGGRVQHLMVGEEDGVRVERPGLWSVDVVAKEGTVDVISLALVRASAAPPVPGDDRYARHVHAAFRLARGREGVMLVDRAGIVRDEAPAVDHAPTSTLQRPPGALAWQVGTPTPGGRAFRAAVDLARYPSLSAEPVRIQADRPAGVDELRFTLDGAVPTAAAPRLDAPIRLTGPTALRVRGFAGGVPVTPVATRQLWIGPLPPAPTLMLALDHALIDDPEIGVQPNDWWRRQQKLPDDPAFGPLRLVRRRHWARERRQWIKPVHLMVVDAKGLAFEGRARLRRFGTAAGDGFGLHVRTLAPLRPARDVFGRNLRSAGRSILVDENELNVPAYDAVRATGGRAPLTRWGRLALNGQPAEWRVLLEPLDEDFLLNGWGHTNVDLIKGKPLAVKLGTSEAYDRLGHLVARGARTEAELGKWIDLGDLAALHFAALFLATGQNAEMIQTNVVVDHESTPPRIHPIGWDMDHAIDQGPSHDTLAKQRGFARRSLRRGTFSLTQLLLRVLDSDPAFRERYLRHAERTMNHVLTPQWLAMWQRQAGGAVNPARAERLTTFFRERPAALSRFIAQDFGLPPPRVARVRVQGEGGTGGVSIDGHLHDGPYVGRYFAGATLELVIPPERRGAFRYFLVNGRREPGPILREPVTRDLDVVAWFEG